MSAHSSRFSNLALVHDLTAGLDMFCPCCCYRTRRKVCFLVTLLFFSFLSDSFCFNLTISPCYALTTVITADVRKKLVLEFFPERCLMRCVFSSVVLVLSAACRFIPPSLFLFFFFFPVDCLSCFWSGRWSVESYIILFLFFLTEPGPFLVDETAMRIKMKK